MSGLKGENKSLSKEVQNLKKEIQKARKDLEVTLKFQFGNIDLACTHNFNWHDKWCCCRKPKRKRFKHRKSLTRLTKKYLH